MKCAVVGLGQFGKATAIGLARSGHDIIAVDSNMADVDEVKDEVSVAICGDGSSLSVLKSNGIDKAQILIASIRDNFEALILLVLHAKQVGIPKIIARTSNQDHKQVLQEIGADLVLLPEDEAANHLIQRICLPEDEALFFVLWETSNSQLILIRFSSINFIARSAPTIYSASCA